jgi:hypothetical protein
MTRRYRLTPTLQQSIVAFIRAGGFPQVAAEAAGLPREVFERWLRQGQDAGAKSRYRAFFEAVLQALAQARLGAEAAVLGDKPLDWLRYGPGRETADGPGWTGTVRPAPLTSHGGPTLADPEVQALIGLVLGLLEPHPEIRVAVAGGLEEAARASRPPGGARRAGGLSPTGTH